MNYNNNNPPNPHFNRNPNSPFYPRQSIPGFTSGELPRNAMEFRKMIQLELEKERIRAELIAEEIMRRRILEDEVRREMMLERELSNRRGEPGFGFPRSRGPMQVDPPRVPLLLNSELGFGFGPMRVDPPRVPLLMGSEDRVGFETRPFQRGPVVAGGGNGVVPPVVVKDVNGVVVAPPVGGKDKLVILAKPCTNLADIKRKAMVQSAGGAIEILKKQKTDNDWSCALCRITATSERGLNDHLQGKKHKTRERGMLAQRTGFGSGSTASLNNDEKVHHADVIKSKEISVEERENGVPNAPSADKPKSKFRYFCEVCEVGVYSLKVFKKHKQGRKHRTTLSERNKSVGAVPEASMQIGVVEENKEAEFAAKEIKGEIVETNRNDVDCDLNKVEDKFEVMETKRDHVDVEINRVENKVVDVGSEVNHVEDKEKVQETKGDDVGSDVNQVEDNETIHE